MSGRQAYTPYFYMAGLLSSLVSAPIYAFAVRNCRAISLLSCMARCELYFLPPLGPALRLFCVIILYNSAVAVLSLRETCICEMPSLFATSV